ncbi:MAG: HEAT repeat domain-containing protein [Candidatus Diapherotrites archaeon]|nr:HEAT repeat domain-containing protein [Candidatus Diapherotrites archaeon]
MFGKLRQRKFRKLRKIVERTKNTKFKMKERHGRRLLIFMEQKSTKLLLLAMNKNQRWLLLGIVSPNPETRIETISEIAKERSRLFVPFLKQMLKDENPVVRVETMLALEKISPKKSIPLFLARLNDSSSLVREIAIRILEDNLVELKKTVKNLDDASRITKLVKDLANDPSLKVRIRAKKFTSKLVEEFLK